MNSRALELMVGLFVAAGIVALFIMAMKVSNLASYSESGGYTIKAEFDNIGGLKVRSPVSAGGVRVGRVTAITYNQKDYEAVVTMLIEPQYNKFPADTSASILTSGLLGEQYVGLEPGADDTYLKSGSKIEITQSALVLEKVISQFLYDKASSK